VSIGEGYLYVVEIASGQKREVDPASGKVGIAGAKFSRDGQGVYLISDRDSEFKRNFATSISSRRRKAILSDHIPWDIEELAISRDGHYLAYVSNEAGASKLNVVDLRTHQDLTPPRLPAPGIIDHVKFDAEGKRLVFGFSSAALPRDAYVLDLANNRLEAWTHSEAGAVDTAKFVTPRLTQFPTFDRNDGPLPPRTRVRYTNPPLAACTRCCSCCTGVRNRNSGRVSIRWLQYVVNELGFAVVAPNLRGSSGYGKTYLALDNGMLRDDVVKDLGAVIVWVSSQSNLDAKHVAVAGSSYGGFLALAALANYGDRLIGGVDLAGIGDFVSFLSNTAPYRQSLRRAEYGDERDPEMRAYLRRISPLTNADRISKPLLVVHGKNDPRVPLSEAEQIVARLRSRGGDVWYLQARDEGHGFRKQQNRDCLLPDVRAVHRVAALAWLWLAKLKRNAARNQAMFIGLAFEGPREVGVRDGDQGQCTLRHGLSLQVDHPEFRHDVHDVGARRGDDRCPGRSKTIRLRRSPRLSYVDDRQMKDLPPLEA